MLNDNYVVKHNKFPNKELIKELITSFLGEDDQSVEYFMRGLNSQYNVCTIEAFVDGIIVGLATVWKNKFHPHSTYLSLVIDPLHQEQVETILLRHVEGTEGVNFPIQTSIWETSYRLKNFYENQGFVEIRRTYNPKLKTFLIPIHETFSNKFISNDYPHLMSIQEILKNEKLMERLVFLIRDTYRKTHTVNPLGMNDTKEWMSMVIEKDLILDASYVILKGNEVLAFALLHYSETPNEMEFGWRGTKEARDIHLIPWLTAHQINFAKDNGCEYIAGEIDSTDPFSLELLKFFSFSPSPTLITYQKQDLIKQ